MSFALRLRSWPLAALLLVAGAASAWAAGPQPVQVPSLDRDAHGTPLSLPGFWWPAPAAPGQSAGAVLMLHGCNGAYARKGQPSTKLQHYAARLQAQGLAVLAVDSLGPRGERELCTQHLGERRVLQRHRQRDALGALAWLGVQPGVDAGRLALLGWSNGASAVLASGNLQREGAYPAGVPRPAALVAFYPGCGEELSLGFAPVGALLLLLGEADDWTPAAPCQRLARQAVLSVGTPAPQVVVYPGAGHGFDSDALLRLRRDVPNGAHRGQGVHVGGQPAAFADSQLRLLAFLRQQGVVR